MADETAFSLPNHELDAVESYLARHSLERLIDSLGKQTERSEAETVRPPRKPEEAS